MSRGPHILFMGDACSVHTQRWVSAIAARGWRCTVLSRRHHGIDGAEVKALDTADGNWPWFSALPRVRALARELAPDLVHGHYITSYGLWAAACGRGPVVLSAWGSDILVSPHESRAVRTLTGWTLRRAALITADSRDTLDAIAGYRPRGRLEQILWGADTTKFRPAESRPGEPARLRIVSLRAWEPLYHVDAIVAAVAELIDRLPHVRGEVELHLLGGGSLEPALRAQVERLGLARQVHFHGRVGEDRMAELVNTAQVSVSIPASDATSVSLLESMAAGLPVIVSDLPANRQWVDGQGGFIVPAGDARAVADALLRLATEPALGRAMGRRNRAVIEPAASRGAQMDRMDKLYKGLLAGRPQQGGESS